MSHFVQAASLTFSPTFKANMVYRLFLRSLVCFSALAAMPGVPLRAEIRVAPAVHAQHDGVTLDAYSGNDRVTFCFSAEKDVKIASEYGVQFKVPHGQAKLWNEPLPKLVAGSEPYFDLPVRFDLKTRGVGRQRQVSIDLGVCVSTKYCTPVTFQITIPARSAASEAAICANQLTR
jgi:hypothetical protein